MFSFLKKKLKDAVAKISKKVEEQPSEEFKKIPVVKKEELKGKEALLEKIEEKSFLRRVKERITTKRISEEQFEELFYELELALVENNVAMEVIDKIKEELKMDLVNTPLERKDTSELIKKSLKESLESIFQKETPSLLKMIKEKKEKPFVIVFFGVNGSGKTTTIAKIANLLLKNKLKCILVAGDTWRSAAIEQLEEHGKNLGIKVIKHDYKSDPAAVAFDGISYSKSHNIDAVLIDTAGRQHSNVNLMDEMKKIVRVAKPDLKIFVGEAITGGDVVLQSKTFNEKIGINGIILTKSDVDEKGGAMISISYVTQKPILFLGNGQQYKNLESFNKDKILEKIEL